MKIAIVTNIRTPYRKLQIEEIARNNDMEVTVYYTDHNIIGRKWNVEPIKGVKERALNGIRISEKYGYLNQGLINIVSENDVIIIGGYEQPTYILLSIIAKLLRKPYVIIFDGISPKKINIRNDKIKNLVKAFVINNSSAIFGNGLCSRQYFMNNFKYKSEKIFNQVLTVDIERIAEINKKKDSLKNELRKKYNIDNSKKVLIYSGRLIRRKNVDKVIMALSKLENKQDYVLLILGDGEERENIMKLADKVNVSIVITGFISNQDFLFKHYNIGDVLVLVSMDEPWGLVINEAMAAGLPVIVSDECGASLDLVREEENGFIVKTNDIPDLVNKINKMFDPENNIEDFSEKSKLVIKEWNFVKSGESFNDMIKYVMN